MMSSKSSWVNCLAMQICGENDINIEINLIIDNRDSDECILFDSILLTITASGQWTKWTKI